MNAATRLKSSRSVAAVAGPTPSPEPEVAALPSDAQIHERLYLALLDQRLTPGTRLVEDELGQAFGVSRTRIRQVLIRLANEQLVTLVPNAGARVAEPTPDDAREIFEARLLIEPALVAGFIQVASATALRALQQWIVEEERARADDRRHDAIRTAGAFHLHIAAHAGNATLARVMHALVPRTSLVLLRYGPQQISEPVAAGGCDCHEHRTILAALKLRDTAAAVQATKQHLQRLKSQLSFAAKPPAGRGLAELLRL